MGDLLKLSNEELFEELYFSGDVVGVEEGIYFTLADITVYFSSEDILKYAAKKGEVIDLDQVLKYYQDHEEEIDKHFFMEQVSDIRECIEEG